MFTIQFYYLLLLMLLLYGTVRMLGARCAKALKGKESSAVQTTWRVRVSLPSAPEDKSEGFARLLVKQVCAHPPHPENILSIFFASAFIMSLFHDYEYDSIINPKR